MGKKTTKKKKEKKGHTQTHKWKPRPSIIPSPPLAAEVVPFCASPCPPPSAEALAWIASFSCAGVAFFNLNLADSR